MTKGGSSWTFLRIATFPFFVAFWALAFVFALPLQKPHEHGELTALKKP